MVEKSIADSMGEESPDSESSMELNPQEKEQEDESKLEDLLAQVEKCIEMLENSQISLEDSFRFYEEGVRKLKMCNSKVAQIEQKMMVINGQGELEAF